MLTTAVPVRAGGLQFYRKGFPALVRGAPEMNSLVALGTGAAWAYRSWRRSRRTSCLRAPSTRSAKRSWNAIDALHMLGLNVAMVTGDDGRTAEAVARQLGIDAPLES